MSEVKKFWKGDDEGVVLISEREEARISYDEFILRLQSQKIVTPVLPYGTIWYENNSVDKRYAIQIPPKKRTVAYYKKFYEIGFPSLIVLVKTSGAFIANVALAGALKPVKDFDDPLIRVPLPNMDDRGMLCLGWDHDVNSASRNTEVDRVRATIEHIETSQYNDHLLPLTQWVPKDFRGEYVLARQDGAGDEAGRQAYYGVMERWAEKSEGPDWLKALDGIAWATLKSFADFVRGGM